MNANEMSAALVRGFSALWEGIKSNTYPTAFFTDALGLSQESTEALPGRVIVFLAVCLLCGIISVFLRRKAEQRSLSGWGDQLINVILTLLTVICIPILLLLCQYVKEAKAVVEGSFASRGMDYVLEILETAYPVLMVTTICVCMMLLPLLRIKDYLVRYHLTGLFHAIFEVGTGFFIAGTAVLAMYLQNPLYYIIILPYLFLLRLRQQGGWDTQFRERK